MTPRYEWVSVHEASRRLGKSLSTIRRMIESGELVGEREPLTRGSTRDRYRVRFDAPVTPHEAPPSESPDTPSGVTDAPAAVVGLLAELREMRRSYEARRILDVSEIADLRERVGRAEARAEAADRERARADELSDTLIALRASLSAKERALTDAEAELRARRWWRWW